jgi:hypothetical protein
MIHSFDKAAELLSWLLEDERFLPRHVLDSMEPGARGHIFRGQASRHWTLMPAVFRPGDPLQRYAPQTPGDELQERDPNTYLAGHLHQELRAVHHFEQADKLGIHTPLDYRALHEHQAVLDAAMNQTDDNGTRDFPEPAILPGFALAQHHRVPTRLLDWTEAPLVAAYFAAIESSVVSPSGASVTSSEIAVFLLNVQQIRERADVALVSAPRYINNHLRAQRGIFVHTLRANAFFLQNHRWPSLEDALQTTIESSGPLDAATLPASEANDLLRLLFRYDITRHHLMPTLDHAASSFAYARALFPWPPQEVALA